jgi:hypothetical protein
VSANLELVLVIRMEVFEVETDALEAAGLEE